MMHYEIALHFLILLYQYTINVSLTVMTMLVTRRVKTGLKQIFTYLQPSGSFNLGLLQIHSIGLINLQLSQRIYVVVCIVVVFLW